MSADTWDVISGADRRPAPDAAVKLHSDETGLNALKTRFQKPGAVLRQRGSFTKFTSRMGNEVYGNGNADYARYLLRQRGTG
ncbi:hypothetical protein KCP75_07540 [Salmonella enterica subsp. enterica]|nr:hypothetical protein KCP75_07540 [Salmonella enterica subsp. enterica]